MSIVRVNSAETSTGMGLFFRDVRAGFSMYDIWLAFAWDEMQARYRRSVLGILWIIISYGIFVVGIAAFFGGFAEMGLASFTLYVALGYAVFQFLVGNVVDGCQVFASSAIWIKSTSLPYSVYVYKSIFRALFPFGLQMVIVGAVMVFLQIPLTWKALMVFPALAAFLATATALQYLLGLIAARFRDVTHLIDSITRILIFMTPVLWVREERSGLTALVADLNPLTHYVEIFRAPIMGVDARPLSWLVVVGVTLGLWLVAAGAMARMRRRLPFWI